VEDPNEGFSDLRDKNDVRMLMKANAFDQIKAPVSEDFVEQARKKYKLTKVTGSLYGV
jgi:histone acetyltransferase 1